MYLREELRYPGDATTTTLVVAFERADNGVQDEGAPDACTGDSELVASVGVPVARRSLGEVPDGCFVDLVEHGVCVERTANYVDDGDDVTVLLVVGL